MLRNTLVAAAATAASVMSPSGAMAQTTSVSSFTMADIMASELSSLCEIPIEPIREVMHEQFDDADVIGLDQGPKKIRLEMTLGSTHGKCDTHESVSMAFLTVSENGEKAIQHTALSLGIPLAEASSVTQSFPTITSATIDNFSFRANVNPGRPTWFPINQNSYAR